MTSAPKVLATSEPDPDYVRTRTALHRVAAHVLGRRRFNATGRFGLRSSPRGFATPTFQGGHDTPAPETIRVAGLELIRELGARVTVIGLDGATLRTVARFVDADIEAPFECGPDGPAVGDADERMQFDAAPARKVADWYEFGWEVLDELFGSLPVDATPATVQLWPEHFDVGTDVAVPGGQRVNLGFSPGDAYEPEPYLYVGPWGPQRSGDADFWNAPFGAVRRASDLAHASIHRSALDFLGAGIVNASGGGG
jgi:hypothetical protein